jgi:O-antigen/teichoic acid export membrane protein
VGSLKEKILGLRGLFSLGFSDIVGNVISMFFWFYIATLLDVDKYGQVNYLIGIAGMAATFSLLGNANVITVITAKKIPLQSTLYLLTLIAGIFSSITVFVIIHSPEISLLIIGYIIGTLALAELIGRKLFNKYSRYVLTQKILTVIGGIGFYHLVGINGIIIGLALSYAPFLIRIIQEFKSTKIDFKLLRTNQEFISTNYVSTIVDAFKNNIDRLIIVPILGYTVLGHYALALQIVSVASMAPQIIFKYILTEDARGNQNKKLKLITIAGSGIIVLIVITVLPHIIPLYFPKYIDAISALRIMSFVIISSTITLILYSRLLAIEKSRFLLISKSCMSATMVIGIMTIGQALGLEGVAYSFVLSSITETVFLLFITYRMRSKVVR